MIVIVIIVIITTIIIYLQYRACDPMTADSHQCQLSLPHHHQQLSFAIITTNAQVHFIMTLYLNCHQQSYVSCNVAFVHVHGCAHLRCAQCDWCCPMPLLVDP